MLARLKLANFADKGVKLALESLDPHVAFVLMDSFVRSRSLGACSCKPEAHA